MAGPFQFAQRALDLRPVAAGAGGDQREQPRIAFGLLAHHCSQEAAQLRQRVVEDVWKGMAACDQPLDGVEPTGAALLS